jgi:hypothetical protein
MRAAAAAAVTLALAAALAACGGDSTSDSTARACAAAATGAAALRGPGDIAKRVRAAEETAAHAALALPQGNPRDPADVQAAAVRALLNQSMRLRLVRSQIERGAPPPEEVLRAAASGLTGGDRQVRDALAAAGMRCQ